MRIPELLSPLVAKGIAREPEQVLTFWHDTFLLVFPPGARLTLTYRPREGYMYLVFGITMGKVRDYDTGNVLTTDDYGFWHSHGQMRWHWDPGVESLYEFEYPHWLEVTRDDPVSMEFYNDTGLTIIQDFSIWLFECGEFQWKRYVKPYLKGIYNLFSAIGSLEIKDIARFLKAKETEE